MLHEKLKKITSLIIDREGNCISGSKEFRPLQWQGLHFLIPDFRP
jgi:hypothetical protein